MEPQTSPEGEPGPRAAGPRGMQQADKDGSGSLTSEEFSTLGATWFAAWDKSKAGSLAQDQLRAGLNASFEPPPTRSETAPSSKSRPPGPPLLGAPGKRNGLSSAMGIEFNYVHADLDFEGRSLTDVAVRYKGNGTYLQSRGNLKRSLKIDLNKNVKGQQLAGVTTLNLHTNVTDASWMNEVLSHRLYRDAGMPAPRTAYARVLLTVPGKYESQYIGLYSLVEDIGKNFLEEMLRFS